VKPSRACSQIHARHEELHLLLEIAAQDRRRAGGQAVAVVAQPGVKPAALAGRQDEDVVLADGVARLDGDAEAARLFRCRVAARGGHAPGRLRRGTIPRRARIVVEILDEPGRRVGVEVLDERAVAHANLPLLEDGRHRHHDGELLEVAPEVVGHGENGLVVVADQVPRAQGRATRRDESGGGSELMIELTPGS
jgi:hypothetical protein